MKIEAGTVMVRALRPFEGEEGFKSPKSPPFPVSRHRAAELKAHSLVEEADSDLPTAAEAPNPAGSAPAKSPARRKG